MYEAIAIPVIVVSIFKITEAGFACNFMSAVVLLRLFNWNIGLEVPIFTWDCVMTGKTYQRRNKLVMPQESGNKRG